MYRSTTGVPNKYVLIQTFPQAVLNGTGGGIIGYSRVTEKQNGNGYTVYNYDNNNGQHPDIYDSDVLCQLIGGKFVCYDELFKGQYIRGFTSIGDNFPTNFTFSSGTKFWPYPRLLVLTGCEIN